MRIEYIKAMQPTITPWGFINSWEAPGAKPDTQSLYWMTDAEFKAAWGYDIPFDVGSNNVVVMSRN